MGVVRLSNAGIRDFQKVDNFLAGNTAFEIQGEDFLEEVVLTSNASSVSFTGLDSYADYKHLQVRMSARSTRTSNINTTVFWTLNGSSSTYADHTLYGTGSAVSSGANSSGSSMLLNYIPSATAATDSFGGDVVDILDAFETTKYKTLRALGGHTDSRIQMSSGLWTNTAALTSIEIEPTGHNFVTGSRFSLYGAK